MPVVGRCWASSPAQRRRQLANSGRRLAGRTRTSQALVSFHCGLRLSMIPRSDAGWLTRVSIFGSFGADGDGRIPVCLLLHASRDCVLP